MTKQERSYLTYWLITYGATPIFPWDGAGLEELYYALTINVSTLRDRGYVEFSIPSRERMYTITDKALKELNDEPT
jgi:uncharacterized membrane protein